MKAAPSDMFGIASGMMRTFANIGMVFSFSVAILVASRSISRQLAFAIFVGTSTLHGSLASAFTTGLHAAFYESVIFMVIAAVLSALRGGKDKTLQPAVPDGVRSPLQALKQVDRGPSQQPQYHRGSESDCEQHHDSR
jgi:hypothetical protein